MNKKTEQVEEDKLQHEMYWNLKKIIQDNNLTR